MTADWTQIFATFTATGFAVLALAPIAIFLHTGWTTRQSEIFGSFTDRAKLIYLRTFQPQEVRTGNSESDAAKKFDLNYRRRYGRQRYIWPTILFVLALLSGLFLSGFAAAQFIASGSAKAGSVSATWPFLVLPPVVVSGIAGAYVWITSDLISKAHRLSLSATDVLNATLRVAVAGPLAIAVVQIAAPEISNPLAFALGAFPLVTVRTMLRRYASDTLKLGVGLEEKSTDQILVLDSIDRPTADKLMDVDISTVAQLAYADPVQLCMRTGLGFDFVCDIVSQALAWIYLGDRLDDLRSAGLRGAMEIYNFVEELGSEDPSERALATALLERAPTLPQDARTPPDPARKMTAAQFLTACEEIARDPNTVFLVQVWHDNDDSDYTLPKYEVLLPPAVGSLPTGPKV